MDRKYYHVKECVVIDCARSCHFHNFSPVMHITCYAMVTVRYMENLLSEAGIWDMDKKYTQKYYVGCNYLCMSEISSFWQANTITSDNEYYDASGIVNPIIKVAICTFIFVKFVLKLSLSTNNCSMITPSFLNHEYLNGKVAFFSSPPALPILLSMTCRWVSARKT